MKITDILFDKTFDGLNKAMDLSMRRHEAIVSNIANAETPKYRAVDLNFGNELQSIFNNNSVLKQTDEKHMDLTMSSNAHIVPDYSGTTKADGNNVDIDLQMGKLAYNQGKYEQAANITMQKLRRLKMLIREAR